MYPLVIPVKGVCELLALSRATVDRLARKGELPGRIKLGGQVRYHVPTLLKWLDELSQSNDGKAD
jgi:excisionase family DNA binding protein